MREMIKSVVRSAIKEACIGMTKETMLNFLREAKEELIVAIRFEIMCALKARFLDIMFEILVAKYVRKLEGLYSLIGHSMSEEDIEYLTPYEDLYERHALTDDEIGDNENIFNLRLFHIDPDLDYVENDYSDELLPC